jgi:hypothetical protein
VIIIVKILLENKSSLVSSEDSEITQGDSSNGEFTSFLPHAWNNNTLGIFSEFKRVPFLFIYLLFTHFKTK